MSDPVQFHETVSAIVGEIERRDWSSLQEAEKCRGFDKHCASVHIGVTAEAGDLAHFTGGGAELYLLENA
jgi:hypothetical protein